MPGTPTVPRCCSLLHGHTAPLHRRAPRAPPFSSHPLVTPRPNPPSPLPSSLDARPYSLVALLLTLYSSLFTPQTAAQDVPTHTAPPDTSEAALRVEHVRLTLARQELTAATGWRRLRPQLDLFMSVSTRGVAFPSISTRGYDPAYAAIARWPGDTWGLTLSWSLDQLLDRRPAHRARAAVALAEARIAHAEERRTTQAERAALEAADTARRARLTADLLRLETTFLAERLAAEEDLLRLASLTYEQGTSSYAALSRQRLATLSARHALATTQARLDALTQDPTLATAWLTPHSVDTLPPIPHPLSPPSTGATNDR